jgi:AcrR family transcriptional regulator
MSRTPLSQDRILEAAIRLADQKGIEALTMRKLARELGVEAMSLYNHLPNKGALVDAMADAVMGEIELPETEDWRAAIRECAISAHNALLRHPWAPPYVMAPTAEPSIATPRLHYMEWLMRRLREAGFSPELTYSAYHALDGHILGFTMWQLGHAASAVAVLGDREVAEWAGEFLRKLPEEDFPHFAEHVHQHLAAPKGDGAREYEFALDLILDGLEQRRGQPSGPSRV